MTKRTSPFSLEVRVCAVRVLLHHQGEHDPQYGAIRSIAAKIGCSGETLRNSRHDPALVGSPLLRARTLVDPAVRNEKAVNTLLEVGCTEAEVAAIVEMSPEIVRHHSRDVNKWLLIRTGSTKMGVT